MTQTLTRDTWDTAYVNDLPDSAFITILPGGHKDAGGKTIPRDLRKFPVRNAGGKLDEPHLRNALARIPQASTLTASQREAAMTKAKALARSSGVSGDPGTYTGTAGSGRSASVPVPIETRTVRFELEVRTGAGGDGRTLFGRAISYGQALAVPGTDDTERFHAGMFDDQLRSGHFGAIRFYDSHAARLAGDQPIGKTVALSEQPDGLHGAWELYQTTRANDALELVRAGEVTGLSIGFKPLGRMQRGPDGTIERTKAHLDHMALTTDPADPGAQVMGLRSVPAVPTSQFRRASAWAKGILARIDVPG